MSKNCITLRGSAELIAEFFDYAVNSILYQRGAYPGELFARTTKYGIHLMITTDKGLLLYLAQVREQLTEWLATGEVQKLVVVFCGDTEEAKERWTFNIETDLEMGKIGSNKPESEIVDEIRNIMRQIISLVACLPLLQIPCTFDLLVYTKKNTETPVRWEESGPKSIANGEVIRMANLDTKIHKVESMVIYKVAQI